MSVAMKRMILAAAGYFTQDAPMQDGQNQQSKYLRWQPFRKWLLVALVLDMALWAGAFLWQMPDTRSPLKVAVGVWPSSETLTLARERNLLSTEQIRIVEMTWPSSAMRAMANRVIDAAVLSLDEVLRLREDGQDIAVLWVFDISTGADALVGRPPVGDLAGLKGKTVGVELPAAGMYLLEKALDEAGLQQSDLNVVPINLAESEQALAAGELDAVVTAEPYLSRARQGGAVVLFDSSKTGRDVCHVLVARRDSLEARKAAYIQLASAHFACQHLLRPGTDPVDMQSVYRREGLDEPMFEKAFAAMKPLSKEDNLLWMRGEAPVLIEVAKEVASFMVKRKLLAEMPSDYEWIDSSILEEALP